MNNFYDTCSLLEKELNKDENIVISSITLDELEEIKTSNRKDEELKYKARKILKFIDKNNVTIHIFKEHMLKPIKKQNLTITPDMKILATFLDYIKSHKNEENIFITNDLSLKNIAKIFLPIEKIQSYYEKPDNYKGYKEVVLTEEGMGEFYSNLHINHFNLNVNEYLIIYNEYEEVVDTLVWTETQGYRQLKYKSFTSSFLGTIKPMRNDPYQAILADSFLNNKITMVRGKAGSGKTLMSLGFLLNQLGEGKIDKIIVFCNTVATKGSARLGLIQG